VWQNRSLAERLSSGLQANRVAVARVNLAAGKRHPAIRGQESGVTTVDLYCPVKLIQELECSAEDSGYCNVFQHSTAFNYWLNLHSLRQRECSKLFFFSLKSHSFHFTAKFLTKLLLWKWRQILLQDAVRICLLQCCVCLVCVLSWLIDLLPYWVTRVLACGITRLRSDWIQPYWLLPTVHTLRKKFKYKLKFGTKLTYTFLRNHSK
jgi:hypothetical protein